MRRRIGFIEGNGDGNGDGGVVNTPRKHAAGGAERQQEGVKLEVENDVAEAEVSIKIEENDNGIIGEMEDVAGAALP